MTAALVILAIAVACVAVPLAIEGVYFWRDGK